MKGSLINGERRILLPFTKDKESGVDKFFGFDKMIIAVDNYMEKIIGYLNKGSGL